MSHVAEVNLHVASTEAQSTISTSLVGPQTSVTTIPHTPGIDSESNNITASSISSEQVAPRCKPGLNTIHAQGMPLAVGVVHGWRANTIHFSLIMPIHSCPSGLSSVLLNSLPVLQTISSQGDDDVKHSFTGISDMDQDGSDQEEAWFLLEVIIEQELARAKLRENIALALFDSSSSVAESAHTT
ncbi:hypothetical protein BKA83DRAFT_4121276 [Pisolithus microcarpus]|nr:hypothetical protein BKA83DRAFT_4121276 [Pisolithus microcarpus]